MLTSRFEIKPWPCNTQFKRKAPGLARIGATWKNLDMDRLPHLIGDIFQDVDAGSQTIGLVIDFIKQDDDTYKFNVTLSDILNKLVQPHAMEWEHMRYIIDAVITVNCENDVMPTMYMECDHTGLFWEDPMKTPF